MRFFMVTMTHPDGDEWNKHLKAHVQYLEKLVLRKQVAMLRLYWLKV